MKENSSNLKSFRYAEYRRSITGSEECEETFVIVSATVECPKAKSIPAHHGVKRKIQKAAKHIRHKVYGMVESLQPYANVLAFVASLFTLPICIYLMLELLKYGYYGGIDGLLMIIGLMAVLAIGMVPAAILVQVLWMLVTSIAYAIIDVFDCAIYFIRERATDLYYKRQEEQTRRHLEELRMARLERQSRE